MFLMRMDSAHYLVNKLMGRDPENDAPLMRWIYLP